MLMLKMMGLGPVVSTTLNTSNANFTAYALKCGDFVSAVIENQSATSAVSANVDLSPRPVATRMDDRFTSADSGRGLLSGELVGWQDGARRG